ncbi:MULTISPECIES: dipeptidase [Paenibacillus]|uniref:Membrane dipeptidase n=1 Tax=Paenibacillus naphthalenovorans TaxID=162209 RepID=A0A0U2VZK8_9BACL|nr:MULTISPECIES: dipeptidase [Paenibacillus]ALS21716.1 membrane dipeptidase [Paenibacillus naphthalenovorans]
MKVIDGHCDVLLKMYLDPAIDFYDVHTSPMDVTYSRMLHSNVKLQCFAIYLPERITQPHFDHYLEYINIFYQKIVRSGLIQAVKTRGDLELVMNGRVPGALLTLEGADALYGNPLYTRTLYHLGVRMIGVTWNYANWAADGVLEPRQGGFTRKGKSFIKDCNDLGILLDVSHLSEAAFWDLAAASAKPFVATHSNVKRLCGHPRNLDDEQIRALIRVDGRIGVTFVPWFVESSGKASVDDVVRHMEYICALGGERQLVLGSDFDGIDRHIPGLEHTGQYDRLAEALYKKFTKEQIEGFFYKNWHTFLSQHLPIH